MYLEETVFQNDDLGIIWTSIGPIGTLCERAKYGLHRRQYI